MLQRTLKQAIRATGVGLHSGERVKLTLLPAPPDTGIVFRRTDLPEPVDVKAQPSLVNDTRLSSTLVTDTGVRVGTIEHLMSALAGFGIDNLIVEVTAAEIPIMDGSAAPFVYLLQSVGVVEQHKKKRFIRVKEAVSVADDRGVWVRLDPHDGFKVTLSIDFNHPAFNLAPQTVEVDFAHHSYIDEISRARTFGFMHEVEYMRSHGLGRGGSLDNAIVIDDEYVLNPEGLRFPDEFVRHKILDAIGDLYIVGHPLIAAFSGHKSGHAMNNKLLRKLLETPDAWEFASFDDPLDAPSSFHQLPRVE
ncbi:UDP-3-O-acyl-N-acetylglucosamine deacetylase [Chromobacterium sphagni]|uniref:UDP-3-O-acyl-N-acetylglucosamine deacetylase n=1 Tax=Chromobacterium sphagni TaxID=1903179 RepID=A0A1S1X643_9NEIS|nr:UDP-3-O-acyl-N-acetylglucosamine deacetylase [Chromobacterium sphagni]OHX14961.1 UDP-3-O-[3-hydroxymyristoyl] N-acetylglucosamine deacetylase [Chromobacterium sphagni]OHX22143.1 UDP-3-O-[3-hydroxymyristoyl] N-acetylglucosamine deacetylase [Chromobacterium sphagni]